MADRLLLTKTDLASRDATPTLCTRLRRLNPGAKIFTAIQGDIDPALLLDCGLYNPRTKTSDVLAWLGAAEQTDADQPAPDDHHHAHDIASYCLTFDRALQWPRFADAVQALIDAHGERVLRFKGILDIAGEPAPIAVHGVQHLFHPPIALPGWPDAERRSRLVLITRGLPLADLLDALQPLSPRLFSRTEDRPPVPA